MNDDDNHILFTIKLIILSSPLSRVFISGMFGDIEFKFILYRLGRYTHSPERVPTLSWWRELISVRQSSRA